MAIDVISYPRNPQKLVFHKAADSISTIIERPSLILATNFLESSPVSDQKPTCKSYKISHLNHRGPLAMPLDDGKGNNPVTFVTSTLGNGVGGVSKTAGGVVGAAGRGVGGTVTGVTGDLGKPVGDAVASLGNGVEGGTKSVAEGVEDAGKGKKDFFH